MQEFIDYAKANPGKVTYASSGYGTSVHLSGELFNRMAGVDLLHIPYRGAGPAFNDLIPGRVDVMFNNIGAVMPLIQGGKLRALGVTSLKRAAALPDVPTVSEAGVPGFDVSAWYAFFAPAKTPPADHPQVPRRHRQGAGRSGDPRRGWSSSASAWSARRRRSLARILKRRDGQVGRDHQGGRNQGRMTACGHRRAGHPTPGQARNRRF